MSVLRFKPPSNGGSARKLLGSRHESSRFGREDFLADSDFRSGLSRIADAEDQPIEETYRRAKRYVKEIAASPSRFMIDLAATLARILCRRAYGTIHYDRERLDELSRLGTEYPVVLLPSHRSNFDRLVLHYVLWANGLPPNYTAGGINMNFFPVGPISRRAGVFFIRRTFKDNSIYKYVLQAYFACLIERRLPLEWYIEAGRSRTGKLLTPRYGLLGYAADALAAGKSEDIYLIPISISYDHVQEMDAYAAEQGGASKERETLGWLLKSIRSLRKNHGDIHLRFGEPLSMCSMIDPSRTGRERRRDLQKLASEVCVRINRVTPITPTSLVVAALLSDRDRALSHHHLEETLGELVDHVESRSLPSTKPLSELRSDGGIEDVTGALADLGVVIVEHGETSQGGSEPRYRIAPGRLLAASYYRNSIVHFFLLSAIAELGVSRAAEDTAERPLETFRDVVAEARDLLEFEFFLPDHGALVDEVAIELGRRDTDWEDRLARGCASAVLEGLRPHRAPWVLQPFIEAYLVVAEELVETPADRPWRRASFVRACLDRSTGYVTQGRIGAAAASLSLFAGAIRLAGHRDLLEPGPADLPARRKSFASELRRTRALIRSLDARPPAMVPPDHQSRIRT